MKTVALMEFVLAAAMALSAVADVQGQNEATNAAIQGNTTSLSTNLVLIRVATIPYKLKFKTESDFPVGSNWNGFVAVKHTPKMTSRTFPNGTTGTVDVSELTLKRGDKTVTLVKGRPVIWDEHAVVLFDQANMKTHSLQTGEETTIGGRKLRLQAVDPAGMNCALVDCVTGEQITVVRPPSVSTSSVDVATGLSVFRQQQEVVYGEWSCVETNRHQVNDLDWKTVTTTRQFFGTNAYMKVVQTDHTDGSQTVGGQTLCRTYFGDYWIARNELTVRCVDTRSHVPAVINATFSFAISGNLMVVTNRDTGDVHRFHRMGTTNDTTGAWSREPM